MNRRAALRTGIVGGGALIGLGAGGFHGVTRAAAAPAQSPPSRVAFTLFDQSDLNFETLFALGAAGYGCSQVGEVVSTVDLINAQGASYQTYFDHFKDLASRIARLADDESKAGHRVSARSAYLRAAAYYDACLFFVLGTSDRAREAAVYAAMQRNWDHATQLFEPAFERVRIPYGRTWMPGYFLKPDKRRIRRPTVIVNNGSDAQNIDTFAYGGIAAIERGYNALIFEGPGQGSMLFEREIFFRPEWEQVVTPIVDYLLRRPDVDRRRIAITGWSVCGESVIRAAAFEHRLAAVVSDPGYVNAWSAFPDSIRNLFANGASKDDVNDVWQHEVIPQLDAVLRFTLAKRSELYGKQFLVAARRGQVFTDLYDFGHAVMKVDCSTVAAKVTSPTLVTSYEDDVFYPGQAEQLYKLLRAKKSFHEFTTADGAEYHDAPMAPQTRNQVVFDWLDTTV